MHKYADLENPSASFFFVFFFFSPPLLIYSIKRLETLGPLWWTNSTFSPSPPALAPLFQSGFISQLLEQTRRVQYGADKHGSCANTETCAPSYTHAERPPSGRGLTLTLKGLCLAPVIAAPQAGYAASVSTSKALCCCVFFSFMSVSETAMYGVNSSRHPRHPVVWVCGLFVRQSEKTVEKREKNSSSISSDDAQRSRTIAPLTAFCLWRWPDRK